MRPLVVGLVGSAVDDSRAHTGGERALSSACGPADAKPTDLFNDGIHWTRSEPTRVTRLFALILGLAAAAAALYLLVSGNGRMPVASGRPLDEIDAESRGQLERVLRDADAERPRVSNPPGGG